tara:strand:- start:142 stop:633 length:492 start_codon:yes stop_codon:yes gene_type:complete
MDYFSHGFWSFIFFHKIKKPIYAVLFGLLPDSTSWLIFFFYHLFTSGFKLGPPVLNGVPTWVFTLYDISHSLIVSIFVILIVYLILKKLPIYMLAWPIAIIMDVFTHEIDFLPTPFLWPISEYRFDGLSWATPWFLALNYLIIILAIFYIIYTRKKTKQLPSH